MSIIFGKGFAPIITATDPLTIITSKSPFFFLSADLGVTISTGVSAWADQSINGYNGSQPTGGNQPSYTSSDALFGNRAAVYGNGSTRWISISTWDPPAPGTTPIWFFCIFTQNSWTTGRYLFGGGSSILGVIQSGSSPNILQLNTTPANSNSNGTIGNAYRLEALFNNNTTDYLKIGSTSVTGTNAGNSNSSSTFTLFSRNAGNAPGNFGIACIGAWNGEPTSDEKTALDAWVTSYYGSGVLV